VNTNTVTFGSASKPTISGLKTVNSNALRLNCFPLFEIFWVYMSDNLIFKVEIHACNNPSRIFSKHCFNMKFQHCFNNYAKIERRLALHVMLVGNTIIVFLIFCTKLKKINET
jgi:hypothetical protein